VQKPIRSACVAALAVAVWVTPIFASDQEDACGAVLCLLAGGSRPGECSPYLARFFGLVGRTPRETLDKRRDFLDQCPDGDPSFHALAASQAQVCQADMFTASLNRQAERLARDRTACEVRAADCDSYIDYQAQGECERKRMSCDTSCEDIRPHNNDWQASCGTWYAVPNLQDEPPVLVESCEKRQMGWKTCTHCTYLWREGGIKASLK
jgi:hypothetical protein